MRESTECSSKRTKSSAMGRTARQRQMKEILSTSIMACKIYNE